MLTRRYDEARQALDRADQLSPYSDYRHYVRTRLELYAGNYAEALRLARANPDPGQRDATVALAAFSAGEVDAARAALQRLVDRVPDLYAIQIATAHAWMGERDEAFRWLDRAVELHDPGLMAIHDMRELDSLRDDPRFQRVLRRMNLAD
jgi:tetratricopeptide (TPR) repeat protein